MFQRNQKNRLWGLTDYFLRGSPSKKSFQTAAAACAQDDRLAAEPVGLFDYFVGDLAGVYQQVLDEIRIMRMNFNFFFEKGAKFSFHAVQGGSGFFADDIFLRFVKIVGQCFCRFNRSMADDMDNHQAGIALGGQVQGIAIDVIAVTRQISCAENSSNSSVGGLLFILSAHFGDRCNLIKVGLQIMKGDICLTFRQGDDEDRFSGAAQNPFCGASQESMRDETFSVGPHDNFVTAELIGFF
jgi:hypothetical protein